MCKFRCGNSNIPYISGRLKKTSRTDRLCNLSDDGVVGDEFHHIFTNCLSREKCIFRKSIFSFNFISFIQPSKEETLNTNIQIIILLKRLINR